MRKAFAKRDCVRLFQEGSRNRNWSITGWGIREDFFAWLLFFFILLRPTLNDLVWASQWRDFILVIFFSRNWKDISFYMLKGPLIYLMVKKMLFKGKICYFETIRQKDVIIK